MAIPFDGFHAQSRTPLYKAWCAMKQRCGNPKHASFKNYGARGIIVCLHWQQSFSRFMSDMGPRPVGMTLERKDNDLGYLCPECCPPTGNCEWANRAAQRANQRPKKWKPQKDYTPRGAGLCAWWAKQTPEYKRARCAAASVGAADRLARWRANKNTLCLRCGHKWAKIKQGRSVMCPKCHTSKWDVPPSSAPVKQP